MPPAFGFLVQMFTLPLPFHTRGNGREARTAPRISSIKVKRRDSRVNRKRRTAMKGNAARREGQRGTPRHPKKQAVFLRLRGHRTTLAPASARASASNAPRSRKHFIMHRQVSFYTLWRFGRKDVPFQSLPDSASFHTASFASNTYPSSPRVFREEKALDMPSAN